MVNARKFIAAAVQMTASNDKAANLAEAEHWVREAASQGARVVALPEVFIWRGSKKSERESAESIPGPTSQAMATLAAELEIYLLAGSILEAIPGSVKSYQAISRTHAPSRATKGGNERQLL